MLFSMVEPLRKGKNRTMNEQELNIIKDLIRYCKNKAIETTKNEPLKDNDYIISACDTFLKDIDNEITFHLNLLGSFIYKIEKYYKIFKKTSNRTPYKKYLLGVLDCLIHTFENELKCKSAKVDKIKLEIDFDRKKLTL